MEQKSLSRYHALRHVVDMDFRISPQVRYQTLDHIRIEHLRAEIGIGIGIKAVQHLHILITNQQFL